MYTHFTVKIKSSVLFCSVLDNAPTRWLAQPLAAESESEMYLVDPYKKCIQSNTVNETILDQGNPINKTSLVANIGAAYYIINNLFHITS